MQNGCTNAAKTQPFHGEAERIESMKNDAIGVFDSGMGGLTTVKELNQLYRMRILFILEILPVFHTAAAARKRFCGMPRRTLHFCDSIR